MRFDPDLHCQQFAAYKVLGYCGITAHDAELCAIRNIGDVATLFRKYGFWTCIYCPWLSFVFPWNWRVLRCADKVRLGCRVPLDLLSSVKYAAIMCYATDYQLYGLREGWVHCVAEVWNSGRTAAQFDNYEVTIADKCRVRGSTALRTLYAVKLVAARST